MFPVNESEVAFEDARQESTAVCLELLALSVQPDQCLHVDCECSGDVGHLVLGSSHDGISPVANSRGLRTSPLMDGPDFQFRSCLDGFCLLPASFWALWMSDFGLDGHQSCHGGPLETDSGD